MANHDGNKPVKLEELPEALTPEQVAKLLQCSVQSVYRRCRTGELPAKKIGRLTRIPKRAFVEWFEAS